MVDGGTRRAALARTRADRAGVRGTSRAGRDLPAAIGVGVALGAIIVASLLLWKASFAYIVTGAVLVGLWELAEALRQARIRAPQVPVLASAALVLLAYYGGPAVLGVGFALFAVLVLVWRSASGPGGVSAVRDIAGGVFVIGYVSLLASISSLMLAEPDGHRRVLVFVMVTVVSDIGGYAVGALAGRHPMSPSLSPKKSWEGFAGSIVTCVLVGTIAVTLLLGGSWWAGALLGAAVAVFATGGDLAESTLKRDLGIKDMGSILPGHGGAMDRLDSLLVAAPVAWALLAVCVPV